MCEWGQVVVIPISGRARDIDACIAPIVRALNDAGVPTVASCCGHGVRPASICLVDGREILIMDREDSKKLDPLWPGIETWQSGPYGEASGADRTRDRPITNRVLYR